MNPAEVVRAYIAFGANLGDPAAAFEHAVTQLAQLPGSRVAGRSALYRSAPVGVAGQPDFINAVIALDTALAPHALLEALLAIEHASGRVRTAALAPRTLDLDLLLYGDAVIDTPALQVPHPRMHLRAFALLPLAELAPTIAIPGHGPVARLLPGVADQIIEKL